MRKRSMEMQTYGQPAQRSTVEFDDDDETSCAHCQFVRDNAAFTGPGDVFFVHPVADPLHSIRRVELVMRLGKVAALKCERVTEEQAKEELRSFAKDLPS